MSPVFGKSLPNSWYIYLEGKTDGLGYAIVDVFSLSMKLVVLARTDDLGKKTLRKKPRAERMV